MRQNPSLRDHPGPGLRRAGALGAWVLAGLLGACATANAPAGAKEVLKNPAGSLIVGSTSRAQVASRLGKADEVHDDDDGGQVWVYRDTVEVPMLLSLVPILGDIADGAAMLHKNRELIVSFDRSGIVRKWKLRPLE